MKHIRVAACMLMLALAGCDNNDNAPTAVKNDETPAAQSAPTKDPAQLQKLAQQSEGKELTLFSRASALPAVARCCREKWWKACRSWR